MGRPTKLKATLIIFYSWNINVLEEQSLLSVQHSLMDIYSHRHAGDSCMFVVQEINTIALRDIEEIEPRTI